MIADYCQVKCNRAYRVVTGVRINESIFIVIINQYLKRLQKYVKNRPKRL